MYADGTAISEVEDASVADTAERFYLLIYGNAIALRSYVMSW